MFEVRRILKMVAGFAGGAFAASWAAIAPLVAAFKADLAAGEQAVIAAAAALAAAVAAWVWQMILQLRERAAGFLAPSYDEAELLLSEAVEKIEQARGSLG